MLGNRGRFGVVGNVQGLAHSQFGNTIFYFGGTVIFGTLTHLYLSVLGRPIPPPRLTLEMVADVAE